MTADDRGDRKARASSLSLSMRGQATKRNNLPNFFILLPSYLLTINETLS